MNKEHTKSTKRPMGPAGGPGGMRPVEKAKDFKGSIKKLLKYLRPYTIQICFSFLFIICATVFSILAPNKIREITNELAVSVLFGLKIDINAVKVIAMTLIIFYGCSFVLNYLQSFLMAGVNQRVTKSLRQKISQKINKVPLKYYDTKSYGDILSRVTNDIDTIGQTLNQSLGMLIASICLLIGVLIAMFITCWQMAITAILTVPLSFILIMVVVKISQKYFIAQQRQLGALNGHIEESYSGHAIIKAFNAEETVQIKFDEVNTQLFKNARRSQFLSGMMMPIMSFVSNLGYVAICVVGGILFINQKIDLGVITAFFIYLRLFQNPMGQIAQAMNNLQSTAAASERVFEFLEENEQENEDNKDIILTDVKGKVEFKHVKFGYSSDRTIINDFSTIIKPGQKVAIVGPTGAGKTTMVNLLMRFYEINSGEILIDDIPITNLKRENVRNLFGMVLQDTWLFNGTIKENIIYSKENVTDNEVINACKAANIDHFIKTLPHTYDMVLDDNSSISSGQKQLLTIARAMIQNSPMLILDEATSNVDTRTEKLIQNAMDKLTIGRTSFVIAHRLSTIKNADLILVMKDGDIVESGNHNELISKNGFYAELYSSQFVQ